MATSLDKPLLTRLLEFTLRPIYPSLTTQAPRKILTELLDLFGFKLIVNILLAIPLVVITKIVGIDNQISDIFERTSILWALLFIVFLGPLFEELLFRLFLRPSPFNLIASLCPIIFMNGKTFLFLAEPLLVKLRPVVPGWLFWLCFWLSCCFVCACIYPIVKRRFNYQIAHQFYTKNISYLFYFSSITFGFAHIFNFDKIEHHLYISPIVMLPYVLSGLIFGYVRIVYGFRWAYFLHGFNNAYAFLPLGIVYLITGSSSSRAFSGSTFTLQQAFAAVILLIWFLGTLWWTIPVSLRLLRELREYERSLR